MGGARRGPLLLLMRCVGACNCHLRGALPVMSFSGGALDYGVPPPNVNRTCTSSTATAIVP
jgi:hypothetical protein